jgi:hypothetical protein
VQKCQLLTEAEFREASMTSWAWRRSDPEAPRTNLNDEIEQRERAPL